MLRIGCSVSRFMGTERNEMDTDFLSPITLGVDPFTVAAAGYSAPTATQIVNPNRTAMLIDEFRFNVGSNTGGVEFATMTCNLKLGGTKLTNEFIPLPAFAPLYLGYYAGRTLTWHLPRPMYVPPNVQLGAEFIRRIPSGVVTHDVTQLWGFSVMGRSMPAGMEVPEKIYVPWASATSVYVQTTPFVSADSDLCNPFDEPLNIDYFTGFNYNPNVSGPIQTPLTVQMTLSNGKVLARDPIPFWTMFPQNRPILRCRAMLQPKEFVSAVLDIPDPVGSQDNAIFTTIGMTGWREMKTPLGALP